jgi:hypothetical protein
MNSQGREPSDQQKHEAAVALLRKLKDKMHTSDITSARKAAYQLSWMQEDGLAILKAAIFSGSSKTAKKAAAYGLRSMRGRMKKPAAEVLKEGREHQNRIVRDICTKALLIMEGKFVPKPRPQSRSGRGSRGNTRIREHRNKNRRSYQDRTPRRTN